MSPGFHGRSLLTRQLAKLMRQILSIVGAAPVVSMALYLARGDTFMRVLTVAIASPSAPSGTCP